jgi:hypothetical protein
VESADAEGTLALPAQKSDAPRRGAAILASRPVEYAAQNRQPHLRDIISLMSSEPIQAVVREAVPFDAIRGDDDLDTQLLRKMAEEAVRYARSFRWCRELHEQFFVDGYGGIVALFLFRITIRKVEAPEWVWVVVGDMPSAYMEFEVAPTPHAALLRYIEGVEEWLTATPEERASGDLIPIEIPAGDEFLEMLRVRIDTLRSLVLPHMREN